MYLGVLATAWFWSQRNKKDTTLNFSLVTVLFSGMFFLGTLSIFWVINVDLYITRWLMWYCAAVAFFFGLKVEQNEKNLSIIFNCFVVAGTLVSLIGMAQYLFSFDWLMLIENQPSSTFGNKNVAGHVIVLLWPFALFFLFSNKTSKIGIWAYSLCTALMLSYAFIITSFAVLLCLPLRFAWPLLFGLSSCLPFPGYLLIRPDFFHWVRLRGAISLVRPDLFRRVRLRAVFSVVRPNLFRRVRLWAVFSLFRPALFL